MSSRKEQKEALKQERMAREQAAAQAAARKRLIGIVVASILVLGIVGALVAVVVAGGDDDGSGGGGNGASVDYPDGGEIPAQQEADLAKAIAASGCKEEEYTAVGSTGQHTEDSVKYKTEPPSVGAHHPVPAEDDIYDESPGAEHVVHSLEHGRIVVWVRPDASEELLGQIKALYDEDPYHVIVVPRSELKEPVAVSAWQSPDKGHTLHCATPNDQMWDAIRAFKEQRRDKGPEFVP